MNRMVKLIVATSLASAAVAATPYETAMTAARGHYAAGHYNAAYATLRTYRQTNAGTFRMDDLLAISACAIAGKRTYGLYLLKTLASVYPSIGSSDRSRLDQQIAACSQRDPEPVPRQVAGLGAGGGSTSIPLPDQLRAGADSKSDKPSKQFEKMLIRSETLQSAIRNMPQSER